jgi:hypothetical protein
MLFWVIRRCLKTTTWPENELWKPRGPARGTAIEGAAERPADYNEYHRRSPIAVPAFVCTHTRSAKHPVREYDYCTHNGMSKLVAIILA